MTAPAPKFNLNEVVQHRSNTDVDFIVESYYFSESANTYEYTCVHVSKYTGVLRSTFPEGQLQ